MFVFSNLATTLDGKIATAKRELFHLGSPADRKQMQVLRAKCDVVLVGAGTLRSLRGFSGLKSTASVQQPANAILSSDLAGISPKWPFFLDPKLKRLLFITGKIPAARRRAFERSSEIITLSPKKPVAPQLIQALEKRGYKDLLVEGGGGVMWDFASLNLIDEYNVTLTPQILGGANAPTLVEGLGFTPKQLLKLKLQSCRKLGNELFLVYRKRTCRGG